MSRWYASGGGFYDRIMTRLRAYTPAQIESFKSVVPGPEPEDRFTQLVRDEARATDTALDLGTGSGYWFLATVAPLVKLAIGIDESRLSLNKAARQAETRSGVKATFLQCDATNIPLADASATLVTSRRGPLTAGVDLLREASRVLAPGRAAIEITIGEQNGREVTQVFGSSQMSAEAELGPRLPRLEARYRELGLEPVLGEEYLQPEYFPSPDALQYRLMTTPILPDFDLDTQAPRFEEFVQRFTSNEGITLTYHRIITVVRKPS